MKHPLLVLALAASAALPSTSCSSVRYGDPYKDETLTIDFGSTDLQSFARVMSESLLTAPKLNYIAENKDPDDPRTTMVFGGIANETTEHLNTNMIFREMKEDIVNSANLRLLAGAEDQGRDLIAERVRFENESGMVRADLARELGRQLGADVVVYGALSEIRKERGRSLESGFSKRKDLYYQFNMSAVNVETAEILWTKTGDIRKEQSISLFGNG